MTPHLTLVAYRKQEAFMNVKRKEIGEEP